MSETISSVSFQDCFHELIEAGGAAAQQEYRSWRARPLNRPEYGKVIAFVESFTHRFLFEINEEMLEESKRHSLHALGQLKKEEAEDRRIEDFDTPFAIHHLFHMYLELERQVPTWQDWWSWLTAGAGKLFYIAEVQRQFHWTTINDAERAHFRDALQWRLGKFYYSAFRELELFTKLRLRFQLPVKYHLLADVLLRADLWMEKTVVSLYFGNPQYRQGAEGRKRQPQYLLESGFRFLEVTLPRQGFGKFWKVDDESVDEVARRLQSI
jgi:hypothetical protein